MMKHTNTSFTFPGDEKGSIFPWVLMLCYLLLLVTFTGVQQLESQILLSRSHKSAVVKQHILEQSRTSLEREIRTLSERTDHHDFTHSTPNGVGTANCIKESEISWACEWTLNDHYGGVKHSRTFHSLNK